MAAVRAKITFNSAGLKREINRIIKVVEKDPKLENELGTFLVKRVQAQVRRSRPLNDTGKLPKLKNASKKNRERLAKFNKTHPAFAIPRSNLTFTGQLVKHTKFKFNRARRFFVLFVQGKRKTYNVPTRKGSRTLQIGRAKKTPENTRSEILSRILAEKGFVMFSGKGIRGNQKVMSRMRRIVTKFIAREIRAFNKK